MSTSFSGFSVFSVFSGLGPAGFTNSLSSKMSLFMVAKSAPVFDLFRNPCSAPPLGREDDKNGERLDLWSSSLKSIDESDELISGGVGVNLRV